MSTPNLLFIMTDQQKARSLDLYNQDANFVETTGLRTLADEGVVFDAAYCTCPLCVPSRVSMLTGMWPSSSGYIVNSPMMEDRHETVFSMAKANGHRTMLVGKDHGYSFRPGRDKGEHPEFLDRIFDRMFCGWHSGEQSPEVERELPHLRKWIEETDVLGRLWGSAVAPWDSEQSLTALLCNKAQEFIGEWNEQDRREGVPFAMWLSIPDPHEAYQAPKDIVASIDPDSIQLPPNWESDIGNRAEYIQFMHWYFNAGGVPEAEVKQLIRIYLAMCKNVDLHLQKLFEYLQDIGIWEDTVILFTSDHGDFNGEHQLLQKFNCCYDGCTRIPLIVAWPGKTKSGRVYHHPVSLVDLPSTLCDIFGWSHLSEDQGQSMCDILFSDSCEEREYTVVESGMSGESLTTKDIENFPEHRYDLRPVGRWCYDPPQRFGGKVYAVRSTDYKLIVREDQRSEFYDMQHDPWETRNVFDDPTFRDEILRHYQYLAQHLMGIAHQREGTIMERQDAWYRAGGDKTWSEVVPEDVKREFRK